MTPKGFAGRILYVDLTSERIETKPLPEAYVSRFLGGAGVNAQLALDHIVPGCDPLGPGNALIYGVGAFAGTLVPGASRTIISAKSPINGYYGNSAAGHFGTMLKFAGYDHVVITGKAPRPVYLNIRDDHVTLEDAVDLWGLDTFEFTDHIWRRDPEAWVSCIGPGGAHLVPFAVIVQNKFSTCGSCGLGAVMGSKNLKGLVAKGTGEIELADTARFMRRVDRVTREVLNGPYVQQWRELGTLIQFQPQYSESANFRNQGNQFSIDDWTQQYKSKLFAYSVTCPSCPVACKAGLKVRDGRFSGHEFAASCPAGTVTSAFVKAMGIPVNRPDEVAASAELANRLGISTISGLSDALNWACELYQKGLITEVDTGGVPLVKGDPDLVRELMTDIAYRRGIGELLARHPVEVSQDNPQFLEGYSIYKGTRIPARYPGPKWGSRKWTVLFFGGVVDPRGHGPANAYSSVAYMPGRSASALRRYAERIGVAQAELDHVLSGETDGYDVPKLTKAVELYNLVLYSVSSCQRPFISRGLDIDALADLYSAATGIEVSGADLLAQAERIITVQRHFNVREGLTKSAEMYPPGHLDPADESDLSALLCQYYALHGWDPETGIPKAETVERLLDM